MRLEILGSALIGVATLSLAVADPPPPASAQPAATSSAVSAASQTAAQAATAAKPAVDPREQRLLSLGYKPVTRNGEKLYCKREAEIGTHLATSERCGTVDQLTEQQRASRDVTEDAQRHSHTGPTR